MSTFTTFTLSPSSLAISSSTGATRRHGPHHSAQKSTRTGVSDCRTSVAKVSSVTALVAPMGGAPVLDPAPRRSVHSPRRSAPAKRLWCVSIRERGDVPFRVQGGGRTGTGGGDRLLV